MQDAAMTGAVLFTDVYHWITNKKHLKKVSLSAPAPRTGLDIMFFYPNYCELTKILYFCTLFLEKTTLLGSSVG